MTIKKRNVEGDILWPLQYAQSYFQGKIFLRARHNLSSSLTVSHPSLVFRQVYVCVVCVREKVLAGFSATPTLISVLCVLPVRVAMSLMLWLVATADYFPVYIPVCCHNPFVDYITCLT